MSIAMSGPMSRAISDPELSQIKNVVLDNGIDMSVSIDATSMGSKTATPISAEDKRDHVLALNLLLQGCIKPWALKAVVTLGILDILYKAPKKSLTVEKILSQIESKNPSSAVSILERVMRFMACEGFFSQSINKHNEVEYGLNGVSKMYVTDYELSVVHWVDLYFHKSSVPTLERLHEAITKDVSPWEQAHGMPVFALNPKFPEYGDILHKSMISHSNFTGKILAEEYEGFKDSKVLVDVGGSVGNTLALILQFHPHLRGINFDLPSVIAGAPYLPGIEHVGGNFYESIPSGDTMMVMAVLHNNSDENCVKILRTIYAALPEDGKLIVVEYVMTNEDNHNAERVRLLDISMLSRFRGGQERTFEHHKALYEAAGFPHCRLIRTTGPIDIIEVRKIQH